MLVCDSPVAVEWNYINSGDWRCIIDGTPLYLFVATQNNN